MGPTQVPGAAQAARALTSVRLGQMFWAVARGCGDLIVVHGSYQRLYQHTCTGMVPTHMYWLVQVPAQTLVHEVPFRWTERLDEELVQLQVSVVAGPENLVHENHRLSVNLRITLSHSALIPG